MLSTSVYECGVLKCLLFSYNKTSYVESFNEHDCYNPLEVMKKQNKKKKTKKQRANSFY